MSTLVRLLTNQARTPVIDRTELAGTFDVNLRFAPGSAGAPAVNETRPANDGPSIFAAVQEQLGLRMIPMKTPVRRVVIDHIERPEPD